MTNFFLNNIEFFVFIGLLSLFLYYKRKNLEVQGSFPIFYVLLYKTKLGLDKMKIWSEKYPRTFMGLSILSLIVGLVGMIGILILMFFQLGFIIDNDIPSGGGLVLPLRTEQGLESTVPVFYVPFWYWLVALFILVIVHEFAHGVIAERFRIRIKSSGIAFFGIFAPFIPGAFVEPDEKQLSKKPRWQQIAVLGAGSTSNFIFGFLFLFLAIWAIGPMAHSAFEVESVSFTSVMEQSSLNAFNISEGEILEINGVEISNFSYILSFSFFSGTTALLEDFLMLDTNETVNLTIRSGSETSTVEVTTFSVEGVENRGFIGISNIQSNLQPKGFFSWTGNFPITLYELFLWIAFLNIGIGLFNLLPLWITDGGRISYLIFEKYFGENMGLKMNNYLSFLSLILVIFTLWPSLLISLLGLF